MSRLTEFGNRRKLFLLQILTVSLPPNSSPSSFHPNAYLPSYLNGPVDADANYYYPYKAEPGLPRMSVVGNVPLYLDEKRAYDKV